MRAKFFLTLFLLLCSILTTAQTAPQPPLYLGTAWYPEQWPESRWDADLELMQKAGIRFVRVGEFAWSTMEPSEDKFDLDWLDRAVTMAEKRGIFVVLGTPSAAPPAWLTQEYPDTLLVDENGRRAVHGNRQHFSFTSPRYRDLAHRMAAEMAKRFGHNPNVIGWQIDNEYATYSYDNYTKAEFQKWLQAKYKTLDTLNIHWTTAYWSQTYFTWDEIPIPIGWNNPALMLDWKRFVSDVYRSYQKNQIDAIHQYAEPRQWITHNFMGWFDGFDHYTLTADLDLASWDNYIGKGHLDPWKNGIVHDLTHGFKRKNFWVMETQPGNVNWQDVNNSLDKGEVREMAWHAIGHGSDAVSYWQWRSALGGQEQYHGTLVGPDGKPVPLYDEVAEIGREFAKVGDILRGTSPVSEIALLNSYDDRWAINFQRHHKDFDPIGYMNSFYAPLRKLTDSIDVVNPAAPLASYKLVVAPGLNLISDAEATHLLEFVQNGGHLVLGARSGLKDEYNALQTTRQPGPLAQALGAHVEQYYVLDQPVPLSGDFGSGDAKIWAEYLKADAPDVRVLQRYGKSNGWLDNQPAMVTRNVGKGQVTYVGTWLADAQMTTLANWLLQTYKITQRFADIPEGVEINRRVAGGNSPREVFIIINHTTEPKHVKLPSPMREQLRGSASVTEIDLRPRDVAVLTK
jgi:beta-galactosidase